MNEDQCCFCGDDFTDDDDITYFKGSPCHDECYQGRMDDARVAQEEGYWDNGHDDYLIDGVGFADPGGRSALRAATESNPRNLPCPNCGEPNRLTPLDRARGYQCDACADQVERGY